MMSLYAKRKGIPKQLPHCGDRVLRDSWYINHAGYGRAWKRIRDKYASEHPFCELCFESGIIVETEEIHHKKPLNEGGTHDRSNLIAMCKSCHSQIHAKRGDYWGGRH